jgi:mannan endo-1,4-beta-mannosidase
MRKLVFFLMALVATNAGAAQAPRTAPVDLRLGSDGEILAWLVAGPFPNVGALELRGTGFARDYLARVGGEPAATAEERAAVPMIAEEQATDPALTIKRREGWRLGLGTKNNGLDLAAMLDGGKPGIAYCYTDLVSVRDQDVNLLFGSDDGAKVYLNGELKLSKQLARGVKRDEDRVSIHLKEGRNRLLFKIEQGNGGWGLLARLVDPSGAPARGVEQRLLITGTPEAGEASALALVRSARGREGSLDVEQAIAYDALSSRADLWVRRLRAEATDPDLLVHEIRKGRQEVLQAAGVDADRVSATLPQVRKRLQERFDRSRARFVREAQNPRPLVKTSVPREDFIRVMPGGRYFVHADGRPFIPIGYNHNPDWPELEQSNPLAREYDPTRTDRWFANLKAHGVNIVRLMVETPPSGNVEEPVGTIRPEHVRWLDHVFLAARKHDVKLMVTPYDTFWMNLRSDASPYWSFNGGPIKEKIEFYTNPRVVQAQKRRMRFLIDRYGNLGEVFCWEIMNEADLWWGATAEQLTAWSRDMAKYVRDYQRRKWGRDHLVSMSAAENMPRGAMAELFYRSPDFDFATTHLYIGASKAPKEPFEPAENIETGVEYALGQIKDNRPYLDGENGPIDRWIEDPKLDEQVFHNMSWSHLASGAAGSSLRWPYRNPHHLTAGMLQTLKKMRVFTDAVDWKALAGREAEVTVSPQAGVTASSFATDRAALVWAATPGSLSEIKVAWSAGGSAKYRVFDTERGAFVGEGTLGAGVVRVPAGSRNVAVFLSR